MTFFDLFPPRVWGNRGKLLRWYNEQDLSEIMQSKYQPTVRVGAVERAQVANKPQGAKSIMRPMRVTLPVVVS